MGKGLLGITLAYLFLTLPTFAVESAPAALTVQVGDQAKVWTLDRLKSQLTSATITVYNPQYKKELTYQGFWLRDLLTQFGVKKGEDADEIQFRCADGYSPVLPFQLVSKYDYLLAFGENDQASGWHRIQKGKDLVSPGPFYLVAKQKESYSSLEWPYQIVGLEPIRFEKKYPLIFPSGVSEDSAEHRGFALFREKCLKCHSINLEGGVIGPELNVPRNITEYWAPNTLKEFIHHSERFRARSTMPSFGTLKDTDIEDLVSYLKKMKDQKKSID